MSGSIIIPTYRRSAQTVEETLASLTALGEELEGNVREIFLVDQNEEPLQLDPAVLGRVDSRKIRLHHLTLRPASVTRAKNLAIAQSSGAILYFFDDDVEVRRGTLDAYARMFASHPDAGFLGGREILASSHGPGDRRIGRLKRIAQFFLRLFLGAQYLSEAGVPVGRIWNSVFFCNFDQPDDGRIVSLDTARGCNWALRRDAMEKGRELFDIRYSGTSLREETDVYLSLIARGWKGFYCPAAEVLHKRQAGGCENLALSFEIYRSKMLNEDYFQRKHFSCVPRVVFFLRTLSHLFRLPASLWLKGGLHAMQISFFSASDGTRVEGDPR